MKPWMAALFGLAIGSTAIAAAPKIPKNAGAISWAGWTDDLFVRSKQENKLVLLDLEAVWCHWCHVMDEQTYADPKVKALLKKYFIAVRVDQDARPDLSNRYEDFGWPATILFAPDGKELAKRAGFIPPGEMANMLQAFVDDPTPGPSIAAAEKIEVPSSHQLPANLRAAQEKLFRDGYDEKEGSWGKDQKFLNWSAVELALRYAARGDPESERMAKQTLAAQRQLIDPAWGGVYQYSTGGTWTAPHFEKIMQFQAENLRIYALAFAQFKDPILKQAVADVSRFLRDFLTSPEGSFYTSQDADLHEGQHGQDYFKLDDEARRKKGLPRIDTNRYARENGWAIQGLAAAYAATGDDSYRSAARKAADWVLVNRAWEGGGFRHGELIGEGPYLGDSLAMGQALLALYAVTGDRPLLSKAGEAANFIDRTFKSSAPGSAGFLTVAANKSHGNDPPNRDENVGVARFANLLHQYTGDKKHREIAEFAMRHLASPQVADRFAPGILLAEMELGVMPVHVTIVGKKSDPLAKALFQAALALPDAYKRIDWLDREEGPLPHSEIEYPTMKTAVAFACSAKRCSLPATKPEQIAQRIAQIHSNQ